MEWGREIKEGKDGERNEDMIHVPVPAPTRSVNIESERHVIIN